MTRTERREAVQRVARHDAYRDVEAGERREPRLRGDARLSLAESLGVAVLHTRDLDTYAETYTRTLAEIGVTP